jgi:hypothetical protein
MEGPLSTKKAHNKQICLWSTKVEPIMVIAMAATKIASMVTIKIRNWTPGSNTD